MKLVSVYKHLVWMLFVSIKIQDTQAQVWSLKQCIDTAQLRNKNMQMGRNNSAIGAQKAKEAKANLMPKISANADYKYYMNLPYQLLPLSTFNPKAAEGEFRETQFGVAHNINANLQLLMPLYNPQIYGAIQTTKVATELTELHYQKTEEQLYFEISNLYYNAQILQHQLVFVDTNLLNAERLQKSIQLLADQSLAKGTDVNKVKLQVAQLSTQKEGIKSKNIQVLNALKFAMGVSIEQNIQIESTIQDQILVEYSSALPLDVRIVKTQNRLLSTELSTLNKSKLLPTLNLIGTYGTTGFGYDKQPNDFLKFYPIGFAGVQLSYPLFNGTVTQRKINQKKLEISNNTLQSDLLIDQNRMQVENAKLQRMVAKKSEETTSEQIKLAQSIYNQTLLQQKHGTANLTDVLLADNALREAQHAYLSAIIEYLKADLELKKQVGGLITNY